MEIPELESISLSFLTSNVNDIIISSSALFLLTNKRPKIILNHLSKKRKNSKEYVGCKVELYKKEAWIYYNYLILIVLAQSNDIENIIYKSKSLNSFSYEFKINDLLLFPELNKEVDKFYGLKNLNISLKFNKSINLNFLLNLINLIKT